MGNKVHPTIFRIGNIYTWHSRWFARKNELPGLLREDVRIREFLTKTLKDAAVERVDIERSANAVTVIVATAKPGFIIGRSGAGIEDLKDRLRKKFFAGRKVTLNVNVIEVDRPNLSAVLMGQQIAAEIEKRMPFRRVMKMAMERIEKAGAKGVKITVAGRLNGAEISRTETLSRGSVPLHNLRADIDYSSGFASTIFGTIGVKVWIYRGEVFDVRRREKEAKQAALAAKEAEAAAV